MKTLKSSLNRTQSQNISLDRILPKAHNKFLVQMKLKEKITRIEDQILKSINKFRKEFLMVRIFNHIAARLVAKSRLVLSQKRKKLKNLRSSLVDTQKIRRRGYYIVTKDGITTHQKFDAAEREYLRNKEEKIKGKIEDTIPEVDEARRTYKIRAKRSKNAYAEDLKSSKQKKQLQKNGKKVVNKVSSIVNDTNINEYPALVGFARMGTEDIAIIENVMQFFSDNLVAEYNLLVANLPLKTEVLRQLKKYLKDISE